MGLYRKNREVFPPGVILNNSACSDDRDAFPVKEKSDFTVDLPLYPAVVFLPALGKQRDFEGILGDGLDALVDRTGDDFLHLVPDFRQFSFEDFRKLIEIIGG